MDFPGQKQEGLYIGVNGFLVVSGFGHLGFIGSSFITHIPEGAFPVSIVWREFLEAVPLARASSTWLEHHSS